MPTVPSYIITHAGDEAQVVPLLIEINASTVYRWTTFDRAIVTLSQTWTPKAVDVTGLSLDSYDSTECEIVFGDDSDAVAALDLSTARGIAGSIVNIWECWLDPSTFAVQATIKKFKGRIDQVSIQDDAVTISCGGYVNLAGKRLPRWVVSANCPYTFKDGRCGYTGADTACIKTWSDCGARTGGSNQARFGGFRNLPSTDLKIILANARWTIKIPTPPPPPVPPTTPHNPRIR